MKICVILMIACLLACLVPSSYGLKCYECDNCSGKGELKECATTDKYCLKSYVSSSGAEIVSKMCASTCIEVSGSEGGAKGGVKCCTTDGCNFGVSIKSSIQLLFLSIFGTFLAKLI